MSAPWTSGTFHAPALTQTMAYSVITAAASLTGLLSAAAHQAMWPAFVCCSFLNAPMEPIALAFIPAAKGDKGGPPAELSLECAMSSCFHLFRKHEALAQRMAGSG